MRDEENAYQSWLWGESLLFAGFSLVAGSTFCFGIAPILGGQPLHRTEQWSWIWGRVLAGVLIAAAAFARRRTAARRRELFELLVFVPAILILIWMFADSFGDALPSLTATDRTQPPLLTATLALRPLASLVAVVGFGLRFRAPGNDLDRWIALGATLSLFADLHYVFTPLVSNGFVSTGDFLRLLSYAVLLVGVWRAIRFAEFGRAVAEERARVAREIHDGLAQYLFAVSTHATMLENGGDARALVPQIKEAAAAAQ